MKSSNKKIYKHVESVTKTHHIDKYAIVHANAPERAESYEKVYTELIGKKPEYIMDISSIVALSAGIGTVAIAYIKGEEK